MRVPLAAYTSLLLQYAKLNLHGKSSRHSRSRDAADAATGSHLGVARRDLDDNSWRPIGLTHSSGRTKRRHASNPNQWSGVAAAT